jgi:hypothetical protein
LLNIADEESTVRKSHDWAKKGGSLKDGDVGVGVFPEGEET